MTDAQDTVAYLGPEGTFTETAARMLRLGSDAASLVACRDVLEVFRTVERGDAARGVVPIENTLEGSVTATLDALAFETDLLIHGELELPVNLVLAVVPGTTLDTIVSVRSHIVALGSSRRWLGEHLGHVEQLASASTARAAQEVAELGRGHAAIVNPLAAERYGLEIIADGLADRTGNMTRFVMVGKHVPPATGWDKTSLVVFIDTNRPGALLQLLEIFATRDLNLTKIESRPTKTELGEYCFFVDVEGHLSDERVGDALAMVKRTQRDVRLLGSYRRSGARQRAEAARIERDDAAYRDAASWLAEWRSRANAGA
jgi:prephenate dehydratase